jgi:hypothetical protein
MYVCMAIGFKCFIAVSAEDYDTPLWKTNRYKDFLKLASIWVLSSSITAVKTRHFGIFFFVHHWVCHSKIVCCSVYHSIIWQ